MDMSYNEAMNVIGFDEIRDLREEVEALGAEEVLFIGENDTPKAVVMPYELYAQIEDLAAALTSSQDGSVAQVRVAAMNPIDMTYDEYETVKKQIIEALDKNFKPKPEKLN